MKALILNSGMGSRMGDLTKNQPKCMTTIFGEETILSRQLKILSECGISEIIITTGYYDEVLMDYVKSININTDVTFVKNNKYTETNYIYSIYCAKDYLEDDILLMHGDLVFDENVLEGILKLKGSAMTVSTTLPLPDKDFKAVLAKRDNTVFIDKVGIEFFDNAVSAQALYKLNQDEWKLWLDKIILFCESGKTGCYAENALNEVTDKCVVEPFDCQNLLCCEIDNIDDLEAVRSKLI